MRPSVFVTPRAVADGLAITAGALVAALCPSCGAKRAAIFSEILESQILADVPHTQWVFSIPEMLRPYFLHHRELLADMARLATSTPTRPSSSSGKRFSDFYETGIKGEIGCAILCT